MGLCSSCKKEPCEHHFGGNVTKCALYESSASNDELCVDEAAKCSCEIELVWSALATKCLRCGGDV